MTEKVYTWTDIEAAFRKVFTWSEDWSFGGGGNDSHDTEDLEFAIEMLWEALETGVSNDKSNHE